MGFDKYGEHTNPDRSKEQRLAHEIANQRIGNAIMMMNNLSELRVQGVELSPEGKEALNLLKTQIENYLAAGK